MPSQVSALSPTSGNKGKKKAATGRKANGRQRARSIEEDRYNAALELAIEEEKENEMQELAAGEDEDEQFDLAIEGHTSEQFQPESDGKQILATPKSVKNAQSSEPATPSKPQKAHVFAPSLILDPPNVRANLKRPAAESPSSFGDLFLTRKSIRANPTDNEVLRQVLEKVEALTKVSTEQSEHIKRLEEKIEELTNNTKKMTERATVSSGETMASQIAKYAAANKVTGPQTSPATPVSLPTKPAKGPQLIIDFVRCSTPMVKDSVSDLRNYLQACLTGCQGTKDIKIKGMNCDAKNSQRVFMFFHSGVDESKARVHEEQWLKVHYPLAKIQLPAMYPIKVNGAKACTVVDRITGRTLESARHSIGEENGCVIAKLGWLSKRDSGKLYGSMVVYLASKSQADKFLEKGLFEVGGESAYTDIWKEQNPGDRRCFNCQRFGHRGQDCTRAKVCGNCAAPGHSHDQCDNPVISCANCQGKHRARDRSCSESPLNRHKDVDMTTDV